MGGVFHIPEYSWINFLQNKLVSSQKKIRFEMWKLEYFDLQTLIKRVILYIPLGWILLAPKRAIYLTGVSVGINALWIYTVKSISTHILEPKKLP